jgi:hypothetical protein
MSDWINLDKAVERAWQRGASQYVLVPFLCRTRVSITAKRDDRPFDDPPDHVEALLAEAASSIMIMPNNRLRGSLRGNLFPIPMYLTEVRVCWPQLAAELESAGFAERVAAKKSKSSAAKTVLHNGETEERAPSAHVPTPLEWMKANVTKSDKQPKAVEECRDAVGCTVRDALMAYRQLPRSQRRQQGERDR